MDTLYPRKKLVFKDVSFGHLANIDETFSSTTSNYSFLQAICDRVFPYCTAITYLHTIE